MFSHETSHILRLSLVYSVCCWFTERKTLRDEHEYIGTLHITRDVDFQREKLQALLRNEALTDTPTCKKSEPVKERTHDPDDGMDKFKRSGEKWLVALLWLKRNTLLWPRMLTVTEDWDFRANETAFKCVHESLVQKVDSSEVWKYLVRIEAWSIPKEEPRCLISALPEEDKFIANDDDKEGLL